MQMKLIKRAWLELPPLCKSLKIEAHLQILACTCFFQSTRSGGASCECFRVTQVADMCVCVCDCSPCLGLRPRLCEDAACFAFLRLKPLKGHIQTAAVKKNTKICELLMNFALERRQSMVLVLGASLLFII